MQQNNNLNCFLWFPDEIQFMIWGLLTTEDLLSCELVCHDWNYKIRNTPELWRSQCVHCKKNYNKYHECREEAKDRYRLYICFGTQSGTSEEFAMRLHSDLNNINIPSKVVDIFDYDSMIQWNTKIMLIFLYSTYGEGEPCDHARDFHEWVCDHAKVQGVHLPNCKYAVFGLGNSVYEHFCGAAAKLDAGFEQIGASRMYPLTKGDDDNDITQDFINWKQAIIPVLSTYRFQKENTKPSEAASRAVVPSRFETTQSSPYSTSIESLDASATPNVVNSQMQFVQFLLWKNRYLIVLWLCAFSSVIITFVTFKILVTPPSIPM